jgi:hypothetical protein
LVDRDRAWPKGKGGVCSVCTSPHRREIEIGCVLLVSGPVLSARYNVSPDSIYRHRKHHLTADQPPLSGPGGMLV